MRARAGLRRVRRAERPGRACARGAFAILLLAAGLTARADLLDVPWKGVPATGVEMKLTQGEALRVDFDFHGRAGYAIARRDGALELPENFELSFRVKGETPVNTLEVKFVKGENVWWSVRREYDFPREWRRVSVKKRQLEFAWGPAGRGPLPKSVDAIELVVTAGKGGKGTVWFDDLRIAPLDVAEGPPPAQSFPGGTVDLGARYEIGGAVVEWDGERPVEIATSVDGRQWDRHAFDRAATWIPLFDTDARFIRATGAKSLRVLPPVRGDNEFFAAMASQFRRGLFPRYLLGEQSYWTVVGGQNGEEEEALFSEDGAIEAGHARFSIEPLLELDGKIVTWNDVSIEQRAGPQVVWQKHLTISPVYDAGTLRVRYQAAPNAKLLLAIRPFQVNPSWQFLNRTGGVVKVRKIERDGATVTVEADARKSVRVAGASSRRGVLPEEQAGGDYQSLLLELDGRDVTIEIPLGDGGGAPVAATPFSLDLPAEPRIAATIDAQLRYILLNRDDQGIHPGSRSYERSWIRDGSLTSEALLRLGRYETVREFIEWYARFLREDGYVPCCVSPAGADPVPEHDSHGQFIYLVAEYYRHTGDRELVRRMWPSIEKVVAFIDRLRHERMTPQYENTAFYGMVPESISHEGYSAKAMHSYWDDLFVLKGLKDAAFLSGVVATDKGYDRLAKEFERHLHASIARTMATHRIDTIPGSVELGDFDATSTTVAVTPVDAGLPEAALRRTFDRYWEHALEPRTYTPYELRIVGTLVRLGQAERARTLLEYFFADQRPAAWHQWAEVVRANPREGGFVGDMPHTWVGSDFIRSALDFFAYEDDGALILAAGVSPEWAAGGIRLENLSTHFGLLDYSIEGHRMSIGGNVRVPENGIVVVSPFDGSRTVLRRVPAEIEWSAAKDSSAVTGPGRGNRQRTASHETHPARRKEP